MRELVGSKNTIGQMASVEKAPKSDLYLYHVMSNLNPTLSSQIRNEMRDFRLPHTVELHLSGRWMSGSPIIRIGLARQVNLLRILLH